MPPTRTIPIGSGLVTSRDASLLEEGELSRADDSFYKPSDPALYKVAAKAAANATAESGSIYGARYLEFDGATDRVVAGVGSTLRSSAAGGSLSFSNLTTGLTGGATLDSVHYNNEHFILNGVDRNRMVDSTNVAVFHGMLAATAAPTVSRDAGSGTGFTLTSGNTVVYWVEERVKSGSTVLRRSASTSSQTVTLTGDGTLDKPVVTRPTTLNSDATHWALFGTSTNGAFPTGAQIAEVAIATTTIEDTRTGADPTLPTGAVYEVISVSIFGLATNLSRNGAPPTATSGDIFQGSLVLNDASDRSKIWYSWPGEPQKFPAVNFIDINKGRDAADEIAAVRALGGSLVLLARNSLWRVNFLPQPTDAEFNRDRVKDQIEGAHGCVGPLAAATFSSGEGMQLAYISRYGLLLTNAYSWRSASDDLAWESTVNVSQLSLAFLVNNPRYFRLEAYTPSRSSNVVNQAHYFHYHPSQVKEDGRLKVTGPVAVSATCAFVANLSGADARLFGASNGSIYSGDADDPAMVVRTGDLYLNGFNEETKLQRVWAHHPAGATASQAATLVVIGKREAADDVRRAADISLTRREATSRSWFVNGESLQLGFENSDDLGECGVNYFVVETSRAGGG